MKILFINPPNSPFTGKNLLIDPIDLLVVATYIKHQKNEVKVLDMDVEKMSPEESENIIRSFSPDVVVILFDYHIPLHTSATLIDILQIASIAKQYGSYIVVGGKVATFDKERLLYEKSPIDFAISYEVELPLKNFLNALENKSDIYSIKGFSYLKDGSIHSNENDVMADFDSLPTPDRSLLNIGKYIDVRTILSSRGCIMNCIFCATPGFWGRWRSRSPKKVVEEIADLVNNYQAKKILFLDDNAMVSKERMAEISRLIIKKKIKTKLGCLGSISLFDEETMKLMYQAGFRWIHYGVESGNDNILRKINKNITQEQIRDVINKTKEIGFRIRTSWIIDLPNITEGALDDTLGLIRDTQTDEIRIHYLALRLGSKLQKEHPYDDRNNFQYIHNNHQNVNLSKLSQTYIQNKVTELLKQLINENYFLVESQLDIDKLNSINSGKVVSLCPMKYGLNW